MERYVIRGGQGGYERLQVLARARMPDTAMLFDRVDLRPGWRCLDVGCGSGDVSFEIARRIGPDGHVTGVDMDETKLDLARRAAADEALLNVDFEVVDVNQWQGTDAYDLVYCRFVLQHLSHPVDLLQRMWSSVRLGGALVVEDADFGGLFCHPPNDGFEFYARNYGRALELHGGDPAIGRKLFRYFLEAGIPDPELRLAQGVDVTGEGKTIAYLTLQATADAIIAQKLASADMVNQALASLAAFTVDEATVVGDPRVFQVWSRRTATQ